MAKPLSKPPEPERRPLSGEEEFRLWLRGWCEVAGYKHVALHAGVTPSQLSNILSGRASLGTKTAARFGFHREDAVTFIPLDGKGASR